MNQPLPEKLGKYQILGLVGRGSMGVVYKALDPEIGRTVAIKMMRGINASKGDLSQARINSLYSEARSAGNLRHQNIITVFDIAISDNSPYIVMDYLEGLGLDQVIKNHRSLLPELAICYLAQAAAGLDYAHTKSIVHCDVKPSNLLIDQSDDQLYILDFGIAKLLSGESSSSEDQVIGTPAYMSPEQIKGEPVTSQTDVFSLAIVAFEALTGVRPFAGEQFNVILKNIVTGKRRSLAECASTLPDKADQVFDIGLNIEPTLRHPSCSDFIKALADALNLSDPFLNLGKLPHTKRPRAINQFFGLGRKEPYDGYDDDGTPRPDNLSPAVLHKQGKVRLSQRLRPKRRIPRIVITTGLATTSGIALLSIYIYLAREVAVLEQPLASGINDQEHNIEVLSPELPPILSRYRQLPAISLLNYLKSVDVSDFRLAISLQEIRLRSINEVTDVMPKLIKHPSPIIRLEAIRSLPNTASPGLYDHFLAIGLKDSNPLVRLETTKHAKKVGGKKLLKPLALALLSENERHIQQHIKETIDEIKLRQATLPLK